MLHLPIPRRRPRRTRADASASAVLRNRIYDEIAAELPDDDLAEELADTLDLYRSGTKPPCEEAEYRDLIQDAVDRMAREG